MSICATDADGATRQATRVLVVDAHEIVRLGFRLLLGRQPWVARCVAAGDAGAALALAARYRPHVALVDPLVGAAAGRELCAELRRCAPRVELVLLTDHVPVPARRVQEVGAAGAVTRQASAVELLAAVSAAASGARVPRGPAPAGAARLLSRRELDVLRLIAQGATNREIAASLNVSPETVKKHASAVYRRLRVRNRTEAVRRAQEVGLAR